MGLRAESIGMLNPLLCFSKTWDLCPCCAVWVCVGTAPQGSAMLLLGTGRPPSTAAETLEFKYDCGWWESCSAFIPRL